MLAILKLILLAYGLLMLAVYLGQGKLVFPGGRVVDRTPASAPFHWEFEDLYLPVGTHVTNAWYVPAPDARGAILYSHGNGGTMADRLESMALFRELGFSVLIYDYGGYGRSTGRASEQRCYEDVRAMWRYLTEQRGTASDRIVLLGRSLGGGVTAQLATEVTPAAVVLESTFLSVPDLAHEKFPVFPIRRLMRHRFDNAAKVGRIHAPILIVHSRDDTLIPYHHGQGLFARANEPKQFLAIRGDHNEAILVSESVYAPALSAFLDPSFRE